MSISSSAWNYQWEDVTSNTMVEPYNLSKWPATDGDEEERVIDIVASLFVGFFLSVIIFLSIAGNLLVCIAVYTERSLRKIGNLFIVSLAISDLFVACLVMIFAIANDIQGYWSFGATFCDVWVAFDVMCSTASILNLCAISLDRYIHIKDPLRYGRWMTKKVIYGSIAAIWLLAALISFLPVSLHLHKPQSGSRNDTDATWSPATSLTEAVVTGAEDKAESLPQCALDLTPTYAVVSSCISFYFPCIVMLAIYSRLFFYAKKHVQNIKATCRPVTLGTFEGETENLTSRQQHHPNYHVSDHKAAVTLGIIMGIFLICWVPFFCVNIVAAFCKTCIPPIVFKILTWLGYSNSAFNPIIYSIFNLDFRQAFHKILTTKCHLCCQNATIILTHGGSHTNSQHLRTMGNGISLSRRHSSECSASPSRYSATPRQGSGQHLIIMEKVV